MARFLIVDDDPDIRFLLETYLAGFGHEVSSTGDHAAARAHLEVHGVDALILDVAMPAIDGPSLLEELRRDGVAPSVVFLLSALPPAQLTTMAEVAGAVPIAKPFTSESLTDALAVGLAPMVSRGC